MPHPRHTLIVLASFLACQPVVFAHGAGSLYLGWNDCPLGSAAAQDVVNACDTNVGETELVVAFSVPQPVDSVLALEITLDLQHASATLPAWWHLEPTGCRGGAMLADGNFGALTACETLWPGTEVGGLQVYAVGEPRGGLNQARIRVALAVLLENRRSLAADAIYYAARIPIGNIDTVGPSACPGCAQAACLVLNAILVGRPPGSPSGDIMIDSPGPAGPNWATWQGGLGADCQSVPLRRRTWGQVKSLYR